MSGSEHAKLAIDGGPKTKTTPNLPMYPGGYEIGEDEKREVCDSLDKKYIFRYYMPDGLTSKVERFEKLGVQRRPHAAAPLALNNGDVAEEKMEPVIRSQNDADHLAGILGHEAELVRQVDAEHDAVLRILPRAQSGVGQDRRREVGVRGRHRTNGDRFSQESLHGRDSTLRCYTGSTCIQM